MRVRGGVLVAAALTAIAGCGGDSTKVVTKTVVQPPPDQSTPATQSVAAPPARDQKPPANLPAGAIAIQGRYTMRIARLHDSGYLKGIDDGREDDARLWVATTACATRCTVKLRRELDNGAFETVMLDPVEGDPTRYAGEAKLDEDYCNVNPVGAAVRRISVKASATRDVDGKAVAIRLDGYHVVRQRCDILQSERFPPKVEQSSVQYRGTSAGG